MKKLMALVFVGSVSLVGVAKPITPKEFRGIFYPLPKSAPVPASNKITKAKVHLGKQLFHDPRLSVDGTVSCASCHNVMSSGGDNRANSVGVKGQKGGRGAPTVWNSAFHSVQFWDGRAKDLEEQAKGPITNPIEMGMKDHDQAIARLKKIPGYVDAFKKVFGKNGLTIDNVAKAIATYERTLLTHNSTFDRWLKGDNKAISESAKRGALLAKTVGCVTCHSGVNYNGPDLEMGEGFYQKFPLIEGSEYDDKYDLLSDLGRYEVTKEDFDKNKWRVPTWRNVALTAPYFHNGKVATLDEAVRVMAKTQLGKTLKENEVEDLVAFLKSLTGKLPKQEMPELPPTPSETFFRE